MIEKIRGRKTYLVGIGWLLWGVWSYLIEGNQAEGVQRVMEGVSLITLRAGVSKRVLSGA